MLSTPKIHGSDLLEVLEALEIRDNSVLDVLEGLLLRLTLGHAALEGGAVGDNSTGLVPLQTTGYSIVLAPPVCTRDRPGVPQSIALAPRGWGWAEAP
jgi:hypothetical protein